MRIGVDATCWVNPRGYGRFTKDMLTALLEQDKSNHYVFFMDAFTESAATFPPSVEKKVISLSESPTQAASASGRRGLTDMLRMGWAVYKEKLDLFFCPSVYTYFPVFGSAKKIVAIHDVIAEKYPELIFNSKKNQIFWDLKTWLAIKQSDLILTVSHFSKRGISEHFGIDENLIKVVTEGSDHSFKPIEDQNQLNQRLETYGLSGNSRFILYVGGIAPHKNIAVLVGAFSKLIVDDRYADIKLVLIGDYENDVFLMDEQLKTIMQNPEFKQRVIFTGYIPDEDLNCFYNAAQVFVLPSFCEGFGLPALEAMSCGTVVIGSETTSIPEVVGDAGLFFDPNNEQQLLEQLQKIIDNSKFREELEVRSLARAQTFSWKKSATETLEVFTSLVK